MGEPVEELVVLAVGGDASRAGAAPEAATFICEAEEPVGMSGPVAGGSCVDASPMVAVAFASSAAVALPGLPASFSAEADVSVHSVSGGSGASPGGRAEAGVELSSEPRSFSFHTPGGEAAASSPAPSALWAAPLPEDGRRLRAEFETDARRAREVYQWLVESHPGWLPGIGASRITDDAVRADLVIGPLAQRGAQYISKAKSAIVSYESFVGANAGVVEGGSPYPPTESLVAWFVLWRLDVTRALKTRTGKPFKGSSGKAAVKALGYARCAFGAPFPDDLLKSDVVVLASKRPPDALENETEVAHAGIFVVCMLEDVASQRAFPDGSAASEVEVDFAAAFALLGVSSMRTVEGLRSSVKGFESSELGRYAILHCDGGKVSKKSDMRPFDTAVPLSGFTAGFDAAADRFVKKYVGKPFIFRSFRWAGKRKLPPGSGSAEASRPDDGWSSPPECATPEMLTAMFYWLLQRCGFSRDACRTAHLTAYGLRHVLPDMTRAAGWPLEDRMELGRWSLNIIKSFLLASLSERSGPRASRSAAAANLSSACANLYSRGKTAMQRELALRFRAVGIVRSFVGGRAWRDVVPVQYDAPSFAFLFGAPSPVLDAEEGLGSDED